MNEEMVIEKDNRKFWIIGGSILVILTITATFIGGRMLGNQNNVDENSFIESDELPDEAPLLTGMVTEIDDDNFLVQEFSINQTMGMGNQGYGGVVVVEIEAEDLPSYNSELPIPEFIGGDGPVIEVVVTRDTIVYQDMTFSSIEISYEDNLNGISEFPDELEQIIELGSADEIGPDTIITVWGERNGDRIIADVILYQPIMEMGTGSYMESPE